MSLRLLNLILIIDLVSNQLKKKKFKNAKEIGREWKISLNDEMIYLM